MRCLYCGKRLALLRKLTDGEFCSAAHRNRHLQEEQKLAVARLQEQGQRSARSYQSEEQAPLRKSEPAPRSGAITTRTSAVPLHQAGRPCVLEREGRAAALAARPRIALFPYPEMRQAEAPRRAFRRPKVRVFLRLPPPLRPRPHCRLPAAAVACSGILPVSLAAAGPGAEAFAAAIPNALEASASVALPGHSGLGASGLPAPAHDARELLDALEGIRAPLFPLSVAPACRPPARPVPALEWSGFCTPPALPFGSPAWPAAELAPAKQRSLTMEALAGGPAEFPGDVPALEFSPAQTVRAGWRPQRAAALPVAPLGGSAGPGQRDRQPPAFESPHQEAPGFAAPSIRMPAAELTQTPAAARLGEPVPAAVSEPRGQASPAGAALVTCRLATPAPRWALGSAPPAASPAPDRNLRALRWPWEPRAGDIRPRVAEVAAPAATPPRRPQSRLSTLWKPAGRRPPATRGGGLSLADAAGSWRAASRFWKTAPADLRWLALALPLVLGVGLFSSLGWLPKGAKAPSEAAAQPRSARIESAVGRQWSVLKNTVSSRAAINLQDDFRAGLSQWEGRGNWARDWQYDPAGFVLTGPLALYRPALGLTDYRFEFLGQIDRKSLNWVYRATDHKNYYAMKILLQKSGPVPVAMIQRYAVVDGKPGKAFQTPLPMAVRSDMFYRVTVEVRGADFTTSVQGQIVDHWSDQRFGHGTVGFFSDKGERARLRWMEVSHQHDVLGRLCAMLAPYSLPSANRSSNQP